MKIAIVHDYLNEAGGAERVLRVLSEMYPEAPIYTAFVKNGSAIKHFTDREIIESKWGWFLKIGRFYSYFRFLLPWIWKGIDLSAYNLVITSCSGYIARGFRVSEKTRVVAYCHTPPKWLYGYETPTQGKNHWWGKAYMWWFGPFVRYFDFMSAQRVNVWVANSHEVANRIQKYYRKKATVVYPPVFVEAPAIKRVKQGDYLLAVARVVGAKGLEEAAAGANKAKRKLTVVGEDAGGKAIVERILKSGGKWVEMRGRVNEKELAELYANAKGYLAMAKDEDFGMTVVEAMAYGVPIIALNSGGYKETVRDGETGILVGTAEASTIADAILKLERRRWDRKVIQKAASAYDRSQFETKMRELANA